MYSFSLKPPYTAHRKVMHMLLAFALFLIFNYLDCVHVHFVLLGVTCLNKGLID